MNKSYKVVFNKVRGALMVANEMTSSVQKKGTKTFVAATVIGALSIGAANAATWNTSTPPAANNTMEKTGTQTAVSFNVFSIGKGASGTMENLVVDLKAHDANNATSSQLDAAIASGGNVSLSGNTSISIATDYKGTGNNEAMALYVIGETTLNVGGLKTEINVESTNTQGKSVYGIALNGDKSLVNLTGETVDVTLKTATDRGDTKSQYSEALGLDIAKGRITSAEGTTVNISVAATGATTSYQTVDNEGVRLSSKSGAAPVTGIKFEGGQGEFKGAVNINATGVGSDVNGIAVTNHFYNSTLGDNYNDSAALMSDVTADVSTETGRAVGLDVVYVDGEGVDRKIVFNADGDVNLKAASTSGAAYGIKTAGGAVQILGATTISAKGGAGSNGIDASNATVDLQGDVTIDVATAVNLAGSAVAKINQTDANKTVKITGNVATAGTSELKLNLTNADSFLKGTATVADTSKFNLGLSNGGTWDVTADSSVTDLTVDGGKITTNGKTVTAGKMTLNGLATFASATEAKGKVQLADESGLTVTGSGALTLDNTTFQAYSATISEGGRVDTEVGDFQVATVNVNNGGIFNVKTLNSNSVDGGEKDRLLMAGATLNMDGGELRVGNVVWNGDVKIGMASKAGTLNIKSGSYNNTNLLIAKSDSQLNVTGGSLKLGGLGLEGHATVSGGEVEFKTLSMTEGAALALSGGKITTSTDQIFTTGLGTEGTATNAEGLKAGITTTGGTLVFNDAKYNLTYSGTAATLVGSGTTVNYTGTLVSDTGDVVTETKVNDLISSGTEVVREQVTATADADVKLTKGQNLGVKDITLTGEANKVEIAEGATVTLVGGTDGGDLVSAAAGNATLDVTGTLNVGSAAAETATKGTLPTLDLQSGATVNVNNITATVKEMTTAEGSTVNFAKTETKVEALKGEGTLNVGSTEHAANVVVEKIEGFTGTAFVDPAWSDNVEMNVVANASQFAVSKAENVSAKLIAGRNSMITLGATADTAIAAFNKLSTENGISWGNAAGNITAATYINSPVNLGTTGGLLVDGSLTSATTVTAATATVNANGLLIVNQANAVEGSPFIAGTVAFDANGALGIVNATDGEFQLATTVSSATDKVYTDNSFVGATIDGNKVVTSVKTAGLANAVASMGIQQTTRRADQMLATAIADRTSFDQTLTDGVNLWVDVAGERFDMDGLENGGKFKSDMAYATFGADAAVLDGVRVGGALQYADGSARSANYGLKNSADAISLTGYASWQPCENGKIVADIAYTKGSNDITSSVESKLNQSVDTEMYSLGVKAQYQAKAGAFSFVPSVGVRVSSLKTDEMKIGAVRIEDQSQTIVQVPVALRINAADMTAGAWTVAPSFKIAYVPTFGDDDIKIGNARQTVLDMSPVQGEFGLRAANGNLMVNANMMLGGGSDGASSVGGKIGVKYVF